VGACQKKTHGRCDRGAEKRKKKKKKTRSLVVWEPAAEERGTQLRNKKMGGDKKATTYIYSGKKGKDKDHIRGPKGGSLRKKKKAIVPQGGSSDLDGNQKKKKGIAGAVQNPVRLKKDTEGLGKRTSNRQLA